MAAIGIRTNGVFFKRKNIRSAANRFCFISLSIPPANNNSPIRILTPMAREVSIKYEIKRQVKSVARAAIAVTIA